MTLFLFCLNKYILFLMILNKTFNLVFLNNIQLKSSENAEKIIF